MRQRVKVKEQEEKEPEKALVPETPEKPACHHFWVIEVANGPASRGTCKYCGEKKEFFNAFPTINPLRKSTNPLQLPRLTEVKIEKESNS